MSATATQPTMSPDLLDTLPTPREIEERLGAIAREERVLKRLLAAATLAAEARRHRSAMEKDRVALRSTEELVRVSEMGEVA